MMKYIKSLPCFLVHFFIGVLLTKFFVTSLLVLGWMSRAMRLQAFKIWYKRSTYAVDKDPKAFLGKHDGLEINKFRPRWFSTRKQDNMRMRDRLFGSFLLNLQYGLQSAFNIFVVTLPVCAIWLCMWWAGWEVSFNKSYEESAVSVTSSLASVAVFTLIMVYLPLAQARQGINGNWKLFYDFKILRILAKHVRFRAIILALFYLIGGIGIMGGTKAIPLFFEGTSNINFDVDPDGFRQAVEKHYMIVSIFFFAGFVLLKKLTARLYAHAVLNAFEAGDLKKNQLTEFEQKILCDTLGYKAKRKQTKGIVTKTLLWSFRNMRILFVRLLLLATWGAFAFVVFLGQFLNHDWWFWLNHPLIHLPFVQTPQF